MTLEEIDAFIAIFTYGSLTAASERLFISQPALSRRIHSLEDELGYSLIIRNKGVRKISLTPQGEYFIEYSIRWKQMWNDMKMLSDKSSHTTLRISAFNSLNDHVLGMATQKFLYDHPIYNIYIESQHSYHAYSYVEKGIVNLAFVCNTIFSRTVESIPLWRESMFLVAGKDVNFYQGMEPSDLDISCEVKTTWNNEFTNWHDYWFGPDAIPYITVSQMTQVELFMKDPKHWMIAPALSAHKIAKASNAHIFNMPSLPERKIYYLAKNNHLTDVASSYIENLLSMIKSDKSVSSIEFKV